MRTVNEMVFSELTGEMEHCTMYPTLVSDQMERRQTMNDYGNMVTELVPIVICDGIPDVDLLGMFQWGVQDGKPVPLALLMDDGEEIPNRNKRKNRKILQGCRAMPIQAEEKFLKGVGRRSRKDHNAKKRAKTTHEQRVQKLIDQFANVSDVELHQIPETDEEVADIVRNEPKFVLGLMKLLDRMQDDELKESGN